MNEPRTIRVTGKGMIRLKPDTTQVTMTLNGVCSAYAKTLERSAADTEQIRGVLTQIGFHGTTSKRFPSAWSRNMKATGRRTCTGSVWSDIASYTR